MNSPITLETLKIGKKHKPFLIAEMSGNHNHSLERAFEIIDAAAASGADALKIQTYTPDTMTIDYDKNEFWIEDPKSLWKGNSLYNLYKVAYTPWEWHQPIFDYCKKKGIICFSTPFDFSAVDFLESIGNPIYKIASFENTDVQLIRKVAATGKPIIASTGMATVSELEELVKTAREAGCRDLVLLKCTSQYPAEPQDANLLTIPHLRDLFGVEVGLSDHTLGVACPVASVALGATVIEKHFTLARKDGGVDSAFSLEPEEFRTLAVETKNAWLSMGKISYGPTEAEKRSLVFRRTLYVVKDIKKGEPFTPENIRSIRPGLGLPIRFSDIVMKKTAATDIARGTPLSWDLLT